jgi:hypothetical protein
LSVEVDGREKWCISYLTALTLRTPFITVAAGFIIIFPVVLYGCETWSLTLREERRLRVFEKTVLRSVFRPKMDEVTV